jgi:hypothetical protein
MEVSCEIRAPVALLPRKVDPVPTGWKVGWAQSRSGCSEKKNNIFLLVEFKPRLKCHVTNPTELSLY